MNALDLELSKWLPLDLAPGAHVAICITPDPASGRTPAQLGMIQPFTVQ